MRHIVNPALAKRRPLIPAGPRAPSWACPPALQPARHTTHHRTHHPTHHLATFSTMFVKAPLPRRKRRFANKMRPGAISKSGDRVSCPAAASATAAGGDGFGYIAKEIRRLAELLSMTDRIRCNCGTEW